MDEIKVILLDDDEPLPPDVEMAPNWLEMEPEEAVRYLMTEWGMDEPDARFNLALARGETDGDTHAIDEHGNIVRRPLTDQARA